ncbi:hypothetical protein L1889_18130 [Paenalcaligenes niemegkensis]|uniref:hypothetical protein n=1 Tax=Paenalcaligenes niemegkensis TaxID=2895469 RepID=UPI001EE8183B|nr:hypothetical protein [Paenalcaligenes niemegkensis]MCQ9618358.1 hypothetical protein [Paenalcaligenes niemegkensis]
MEENPEESFDAWITSNYPMFELTGDREEDTTARLVRIVAWDLFNQRSELLQLLAEARQQLPLAAACWNEDENREIADTSAKRVLGLIARIDAAMEQQP